MAPVRDPLSTLPVDPDARLTAAANALLDTAIATARDMLDNGSPAMKLNVIKAVMPAIGRAAAAGGKSESEEIAELRATLETMMATMTGSSRAS